MRKIIILLYFLATLLLVCEAVAQTKSISVEGLLWRTDRIPVCWLNPESDANGGRATVVQAVNDSWAKYIGKNFEWNDKCKPLSQVTEPEIRILIDPNAERSNASIGTYSWILTNGKWVFPDSSRDMKMVTTDPEWRTHTMYLSFGPYYYFIESKKALRFTAIHEFGHALGFLHEQTADNVPESCLERLEQLGGSRNERKMDENSYGSFGIIYADYDADSIMNYCRPNLFSDSLSLRDIRAVQSIYPKSTTDGSTVSITANKTAVNTTITSVTSIIGNDSVSLPKNYYIVSDRRSEKCLTAVNSSIVKMLKCAKNDEKQLWAFTENPAHNFIINPKINPEKTLTISKNNIDKLASGELRTKYQEINVILDNNQNEASSWFRTPINENEYILQLSLSGFVLDRDTWDESREKVILYKNWKGGNQIWRITKALN